MILYSKEYIIKIQYKEKLAQNKGDIKLKLSEIKPFVRYVRYLNLTQNSYFDNVLPIDVRIFYVKEGIGKIRIKGTDFTVSKGGLIYINSWVEYTLLPSDVCFLAVNFDFTDNASEIFTPIPPIPVTDKEKYEPIEHTTFEDTVALNEYIVLPNSFSLEAALERLEKEYSKKSPYFIMKNSAQLTEILIEILRKNEFFYSSEMRFDAEKIAAYIQAHYYENIDNKALGEIFHFHPNYLSGEFCRYFGKPIHKYLLEQRILRAVALLESGSSNISEIAFSVGFSDANYFSRYFKKIMGVSPAKYIKNKSKD